jgi:hypothetical protein
VAPVADGGGIGVEIELAGEGRAWGRHRRRCWN